MVIMVPIPAAIREDAERLSIRREVQRHVLHGMLIRTRRIGGDQQGIARVQPCQRFV